MTTTLHPYPAYKDSGVPWLGDVPEHWDVCALKRVAWFKSGAGFPIDNQGEASGDVPFFKVSDMTLQGNGKVMVNRRNTVSFATARKLGATIFPPGAILFPKVGGALLTNKRRVTDAPCCIDNNLMACVTNRGSSAFVLEVLRWIDFGRICKPGPVPAISEGEVGEFRVAFPSLPEQRAIVRYLDYMGRRIRRYIRAKQGSSSCWRRRSRPSSIAPSPGRSTSAPASPTRSTNPPASSGWATCRQAGRCGG